jgi:nucleolar protein 12
VRIIRDNKTGVGKGIGYVSFKTSDAIALAIKLNNSEIDDRKIRVQRCSKKQKVKKTQGGKGVDENKKKKSFVRNDGKKPIKFNRKEKSFEDKKDPKKKNKKKFSHKNPLKMIKTNKRPSNTFKL